MTTSTELLSDAIERIRGVVHRTLAGLDDDQLTFRIDPEANTIAWLVWHLTRVQDDHVADVAGTDQVWTTGGWQERFALPFEASATGYGQSATDVGAVRGVSAEDLGAYHDAVADQTLHYLGTLGESDLDRVVDMSWNPPVTLAVRLVSVISDDLQHAGQASFVRGVLTRRA